MEAIKAFQTAEKLAIDGKMTSAFIEALYAKAGKGKPPNGSFWCAAGFKPMFETPVMITEPEMALGTHFLQFQDIDATTGKGEWFAMTLDNALPGAMKKRLGITMEEDRWHSMPSSARWAASPSPTMPAADRRTA